MYHLDCSVVNTLLGVVSSSLLQRVCMCDLAFPHLPVCDPVSSLFVYHTV